MDQLNGALTGVGTLGGSMSVPPLRQTNPFEGAYEYTPTSETQVVEINGLRATEDIIINAIPNNYGLITWNGATLTVS